MMAFPLCFHNMKAKPISAIGLALKHSSFVFQGSPYSYPFSPLVVIPWMNSRWKKRKTIRVGIEAMIAPAISMP
ncbi:hypothetical protein EDC14_104029 [Hydrogenispora ethanolica]|uniref:Uncharacterized protein n=1 Tax=Hydrogenispora ethanolica TaxID=1082276 RepID=A0A4R1R0J5_HYDET|nr:hypothetical protein EDC14_104029 [Hydrogenispora ethanolica]